jgi:hypothetical protein
LNFDKTLTMMRGAKRPLVIHFIPDPDLSVRLASPEPLGLRLAQFEQLIVVIGTSTRKKRERREKEERERKGEMMGPVFAIVLKVLQLSSDPPSMLLLAVSWLR